MATARASVADIRSWQLGQPREQLHRPSRVAQMSFSWRKCCFSRPSLVAASIFPHTKWLPKITVYRDTAALKFLWKRIFWWKPCEKIQWRSWYKMPSKLHGCQALVFCTKLYIKTGLFSVFVFTIFFSFSLSNGWCPSLDIWHTSCPLSVLQYLVSDFWYLFSFKSYSPFCTEKWAKNDMRAYFST